MDFKILADAGINITEALKRFEGNDVLYARMLKKFVEEPTYVNLERAVQQNDMREVLKASHTLKGLCGILSLSALFELFSTQVSLIRSGEYAKALEMMSEIDRQYQKTVRAITEWLNAVDLSAV